MRNRAQQLLEDRPVTAISEMGRELRDMKTRQLFGADTLPVAQSADGILIISIGAGDTIAWGLNIFATVKRRYLSEPKYAWFINNDLDPNYAWPHGASITPADLELSGPYVDHAHSDELGNGNKTYFVTIKNNTGSPITLYAYVAVLYPSQDLSI